MSKPEIGFIGLGLMGDAMVQCLQKKGNQLHVMANRSRTNVEAAVARGAFEHTSGKAVAEASDIVMLCMDTSKSVEARMLADDGILAGLSEGKTVIDFGTSLPASTRVLGEKAAAIGAGYMDAPLGRTPAHALDGALNIMGAGDIAVLRVVVREGFSANLARALRADLLEVLGKLGKANIGGFAEEEHFNH